jgi:electron transport complex protein RnfG
LVLALASGVALALVDGKTAQRITENRQQQLRRLAQRATLCEHPEKPLGKDDESIELEDLGLRSQGLWAYRVVPAGKEGSRIRGYAVVAEGLGWDKFQVLIGLSSDLRAITGLQILECRETPGLGERIRTEAFRSQYRKSTARPLELVRHKPESECQVQAITGATISSQAVTGVVNAAVQKARELISLGD